MPTATNTPSPTATHTPAPTLTPVRAIFGPRDGSLTEDGGVASFYSSVNLADLVAETTFVGDLPTVSMPMRLSYNPVTWQTITLAKTSDSSFAWHHRQKQDGADAEEIQTGVVSNIRTGANARNHIRVAAHGDMGLLFINGAFVASLDFSGVTGAGDVGLFAFGERDNPASARNPVSVRFEDFTIRPLAADAFEAMKPAGLPTPTPAPTSPTAFGPVDGSLTDDDGLASFRSGVNLADFGYEVTFVGDLPTILMTMRAEAELEKYQAVILDPISGSSFAWRHRQRQDGADAEDIQSGVVSNMRTGANARNHIRVAAHGGAGLLFINGAFVAELDFSAMTDSGEVILSASGELDVSTFKFAPVSVRFENFTINPLDADAFEAMKPAGLATPTPAPTATPTSARAFGPVNGSLTDSDGVATFRSGVNIADFVAEVTFVGDLPRIWITMRSDAERENLHAVTLDEINGSSLTWEQLRNQDSDIEIVQTGVLPNIQTGANARNHVRVIAYGDVGLLFINGAFVSELDFSGVTSAGNVELAAFGEKDSATSEREPVSVRFEDFTVRPLEFAFGPRSGAIEHEDTGGLEGLYSQISISDGVIEAAFSNPYPTREGTWSVAILFRHTGFAGYATAVSSSSAWHHSVLTQDADSWRYPASGYSEHISTGADGTNRVRVVAIGEDGWLFINGAFVANLDLSGGPDFGEVAIAGSFFKGDRIPGRFTRFADFTIHSIAR